MTEASRPTQRLPQNRRRIDATNRFDFDKTKIPPHMEYGWKRVSIAGMEDTENMVTMEMNGWVPVPANRHPELAGLRATETQAIVRGGLMLMELPKEYARESRDIDNFEAKNSLEEQIQRLGLQARRNGARGIGRSLEPIAGEVIE